MAASNQSKVVSKPARARASKKPETSKLVATALPRMPQRAAGKVRFQILLDAADRLLDDRDAGEISLYDIAEAAKVPTASVYHFLPSMAAAFVGLAQRYLDIFEAIIAKPLDHDSLASWRDIFLIKGGMARQFYDTHNVARKLFLGSEYSWQVRQADIQSNRIYAKLLVQAYNSHFMITDADFLVDKVETAIGLCDSVWALSYLRHGHITDAYHTESLRAFHAYMGLFIAECSPKRAVPLASPDTESAPL